MKEKKENKETKENQDVESKKLSDEVLEKGTGGYSPDNPYGEQTGLSWNSAGMEF